MKQSFLNDLSQKLPSNTFEQAPNRYLEEPRGRWSGTRALLARPRSTQDVSLIIKAASDHVVPVIPYGGGTGLVGGQIKPAGYEEPIILSLERMREVRAIFPQENVMIVEAGCILADIQTKADQEERLFPLSLAAEGSARIGGNLATNAGGIKNMAISMQLWDDGGTLDQVNQIANELGWKEGDEIVVKIAGSRTSGIHQTESANPKWAPPYGDVRHNRDAQIVIENVSRRDLSKSTPMDEDELLTKFRVSSDGKLYKAHQLEELSEPSPMDDSGGHPWIQLIDWARKALSK